MVYLTNAFSLQMLNGISEARVSVKKISADQVCRELEKGFVSAVGHEDTAKFLSQLLGIEVPYNRFTLRVEENDVVIVAQYIKGRLNGDLSCFSPDDFSFYEVKVLERRV